MRLSQRTIGALPRNVSLPEYDWQAQRAGIVHFGIGAFHRAHQAAYTDAAMSAGERLGISHTRAWPYCTKLRRIDVA